MFQGHNYESAHASSEKSRKKSYKKTHGSPKRKYHSKHSHNRKKKWESKFNNLNSSEYVSDYIGPNRLTKHMGFLAKGKISDSISRLEEIVPENLKARTRQDLHKILEVPNNTTIQNSIELEQYAEQYVPNDSSDDEATSFDVSAKHFINGRSKKKLDHSSIARTTPVLSKTKTTPVDSLGSSDEFLFCQEVITKKLHSSIASTNSLLFPSFTYQGKLINDLLTIKSLYESTIKHVPNSSNCESSQDTYRTELLETNVKRINTEQFELNPVLTQETNSPKQLHNLFPNSQDSSPESEGYIEAEYLLKNKLNSNFNKLMGFASKSLSSNSECFTNLMLRSPSYSTKSSTWIPEKFIPKISPVKFIPDIPPTPKLYYRQKMF